MYHKHLTNILVILGGLLLLTSSFSNRAYADEPYPAKPITMYIGSTVGGTVDLSVRALIAEAEKHLSQPFVPINNGGGGGAVPVGLVAKQRPDGYNLVGCANAAYIRVPQFTRVTFKVEDLTPIATFLAAGGGIVVKADSPWKTLKDLVEYAKANPGKVKYAANGLGTAHQMAMEYIAKQDSLKWTFVPYQGSLPAVTAVLGGHVAAASVAPEFAPFVMDGKLRLLALTQGKKMKLFPDAPTLVELGYNYVNDTTFVVLGPRGTPQPIIKKLNQAFEKAVKSPDYVKTITLLQYDPMYMNAEETKAFLTKSYETIGKLIKELKLPTEQSERKD